MKPIVIKAGLLLALLIGLPAVPLAADEPERDGPWLIERTADGKYIQTAKMTLHPQPEPRPALKHRLIPDPFDTIEGNSAIFYLKAMGFLEQTLAVSKLSEFRAKNRKLAEEQGVAIEDMPPYSWSDLAPKDLPVEEVKQYLSLTAFQPPLLAEATRRSKFELDRNIREVASPIAYLLPEIQTMRELARTQSLRCRLAIAEGRMHDAVTILQQQVTMAKHLGTDEFIISNLVGSAVLGIAISDAVYLLQELDSPNLYWAFASLPLTLIDVSSSLPFEKNLLLLQVKEMRDVDEKPRTNGYWQDFIDRVLPQLRDLEFVDTRRFSNDTQVERAAFVSAIAASYPGAKRYLIEKWKMERSQVEAYPTAQVVFLAVKRFHEEHADENFKWFNVPYSHALQNADFKAVDERLNASSNRLGWASAPARLLLPATQAILTAQARTQQQVGLMQTIESIRMYGALNAGKLPPSLADLPYPAPDDPFTGKPFAYELSGDSATLSGQPTRVVQYRFELNFAK